MFSLLRLTILSLGLFAVPLQSYKILEGVKDDHIELAEVVLHMVQHYVSPKTNTLIIMERCKFCLKESHNFHARLLEHFMCRFDTTMTLQLFLAKQGDKPWEFNLFVVDSFAAFRDIGLEIPETLYEREFYFFIILTANRQNYNMREWTIRKIFEQCFEFNVMNVVVLQEYPQGVFSFYKYSIIQQSTCEKRIVVNKFNQYVNGSLETKLLFPMRYLNMHGCPLKVCAHVLPPLLIYFGNLVEPIAEHLSGFEGHILHLLAENMHFRIELSIPQGRSDIGLHNDSTGCFHELETGAADVAIGGFGRMFPNWYVFTTSVPYHQTPYVIAVRSSLYFGPIKQLTHPFKGPVWLCLLITFIFAMAAITFVNTCTKRRTRDFIFGARNLYPGVALITIFFGNPMTYRPRRNFARFLVMCWMLITLVLRNAYQGKMFDSLRIARHMPQPRGIAELIEKKYGLLASSYWDYYPRNLTIIAPTMTERYTRVESSPERLGFVTLFDTLAYYKFEHWNSSLTYVAEPIYAFQSVMYFQKHSHLQTVFDKKLKHLISSGITSYFVRKNVKEEVMAWNVGAQRMERISNHMLRGLYTIYMMLIWIACCCFFLEMRSRKSRRLRRIVDWLHN